MSTAVATLLVIAACLLTSALALLAARLSDRGLWIGIGAVTLLFALHKALHGQDLVIAHLKHLAQDGGWYAGRRGPQWVVTLVVALCAAGVVLGRSYTRPGPARIAAALAVSLVAYATVGMISLHAWDRLVSQNVGGVTIYTIIELALPLGIAGCAGVALRRRERAG